MVLLVAGIIYCSIFCEFAGDENVSEYESGADAVGGMVNQFSHFFSDCVDDSYAVFDILS